MSLILNLIRLLDWSVTFQIMHASSLNKSTPSQHHYAGLEEGGAVAFSCLLLIKLLVSKFINDHNFSDLLLDFFVKTIFQKSELSVLSDAMSSSLIKSPSEKVRVLALSLFRWILGMKDSKEHTGTISSSCTNSTFFLGNVKQIDALSVLTGLLVIGRERRVDKKTHLQIISRCTVLFDLINELLTDIFLLTNSDQKKLSTQHFLEQIKSHHQDIESDMQSESENSQSSRPPSVRAAKDFGGLCIWGIKEIVNIQSREHKISEKDQNEPSLFVDSFLVGLLNMIKVIISMYDHSSIKLFLGKMLVSPNILFPTFIFEKYAFTPPQQTINESEPELKPHAPHIISPQTRESALALLLSLSTNCDKNLNYLFSLIRKDFHDGPPRLDILHDWGVDPTMKQKSVTGHVGMKNQGATCYLNSLLQQFFHTPAFRCGILSCSLEQTGDSFESSEGLLNELQGLFGRLLNSERRDFDACSLVKSIRGYDGNPIRPGEQQDVDEFFNLFCDRLETSLKSIPQRQRLLHDVFGGELSHLITCQQCKYSSERVEEFLSISLDVKGKKNIIESLDLYIQGETLDGSNQYFCSNCDAKRDSIKKCCVKTLREFHSILAEYLYVLF